MNQAMFVMKSVFSTLMRGVEMKEPKRGQSNTSHHRNQLSSIENKLATLRQNEIKLTPSLQTMANSEMKIWKSMVEESSLR